MQTFLPYRGFVGSAVVLDNKRLGKQRVEVIQIAKSLLFCGAWGNHPATKMWRGSFRALCDYGLIITNEWKNRGFQDTCYEKILMLQRFGEFLGKKYTLPSWLGDEQFHLAHRSNLIRKVPEIYGKLWPDVPNNLPYVWPVNTSKE